MIVLSKLLNVGHSYSTFGRCRRFTSLLSNTQRSQQVPPFDFHRACHGITTYSPSKLQGKKKASIDKFANICGNAKRVDEVVDLTVTKDISHLLANNTMTYLTLSLRNEQVPASSDAFTYPTNYKEDTIQACILPRDLKTEFPAGRFKEYSALAPNVILRRSAPADQWRFTHTMNGVTGDNDYHRFLAWIGKSMKTLVSLPN